MGLRDGLRDALKGLLGIGSQGEPGDKPLFRCIKCGEEFERGYTECPSCGAPYVVETDQQQSRGPPGTGPF